ncbi:hypothetical protein AZF37_01950 [endosymbiont 'TC1' of Trimyema compressum]|uniref:molybdopterin biosynthesis protein n=1 Tax=endosymbiont 'TC1' of Trimyema compressum TaxID=243899 RepID=UPI0007F17828|nr:molybdopterin biosynthesis protein [endosymbiont 'TC1' of Trimyema compressum]AMP20105.1 hypothetical protein AZF37_01950 [endosymbiont 'TC1' of Trimyema compressum]
MGKRNLYLSNIPVAEALGYMVAYLEKEKIELGIETVPVADAVGRVTGIPIYAKKSNPLFLSSAMDGIATIHTYLKEAKETNPIILETNQFEEIDTGDKVRPPFNCVVPAEEVTYLENGKVELIKSVTPWSHVRPVGEDIGDNELIVPIYHTLTPYDTGVVLNGGWTEIEVLKKPHIVLIPTGDEMISPYKLYKEGKLIDCNSTVFKGILEEIGGKVTTFPIVADDKFLLKKAIMDAVNIGDIVVINAGSSAGRDDYTVHIIRELGEVFCHGIAMCPGKPTVLGGIAKTPVLGIPGFPVSAAFSLETFVKPLIARLLKRQLPDVEILEGTLATQVPSQFGALELVRVLVGKIEEQYKVLPLPRGSSSLSSLSKADGLIKIPPLSQGYEKGESVKVELLSKRSQLAKRLVFQGSHDFTLDVLKNTVKIMNPQYELITTNVGSLTGILAVKNKEAHGAGIHLLNEETHTYNFSYIDKYLGKEGHLIHIAKRQQGLILPKGNPQNIHSLKDVIDKEGVYVNRQLGAGTRVLLDYLLKKEALDKKRIEGYNQIVYTHLEVGARIASGQADVGMGIYSAAALYDLDFIPITEESYDLCCLDSFMESYLYELFIKCLKESSFREKIEQYGGYDLRESGKVLR